MTPTPSFAERSAVEFENEFKHIGKCSEQKFDAECFCGLDEEKGFLLAKLAEAEQRTATAFGGCKFCYGKGYGTATEYKEGSDDFGGEAFREKLPSVIPCPKCERGEQLDKFFKEAEQRGYDRGRSYFKETALEVAKEANHEQALIVAEQHGRDSAVLDFKQAIKLCGEMYGRGGCGAIYDTLNEAIDKSQAAYHLTTPS